MPGRARTKSAASSSPDPSNGPTDGPTDGPAASKGPAAPATSRRPGKVAILRAAIEVMGEQGYEGASTRDMATRAGVSVAAMYHHYPSKLALLTEFLDEAYDITLARIDRRLDGVEGPVARLESVMGTLVWTHLHDEFAQRASAVAFREHVRLEPTERAAVEVKRQGLLDRVEAVVVEGLESGDFTTSEPREVARAIVSLALSLVGIYREMGRDLDDVITLYQGFAVALARS